MADEKLTITVWPEWWLRIISDEVAAGVARGWDPPEWFKSFWLDFLLMHGLRMSPSRHTIRRWERMRKNEKTE